MLTYFFSLPLTRPFTGVPVIVQLDNTKLNTGVCAARTYVNKKTSGSSGTFTPVHSDEQYSATAEVVAAVEKLSNDAEVVSRLVDFSRHLDDVKLNWLNTELNEVILAAQ